MDNDSWNILTERFADGSTASTTGMTYGVKWEYGLGGKCKEHTLDLHILPNAPADVILSDDFLYDTEAFAEYDCYLVDYDDDDADEEGYLIDDAYIQEARREAKEEQQCDDEVRKQFVVDSSRHLLSLSQAISPCPSPALNPAAAVPASPSSVIPHSLGVHGPGGSILTLTSSGGTSPTGSASPSGLGSPSPIGSILPPSAPPPTPPVKLSGTPPQSWSTKLEVKLKGLKASDANRFLFLPGGNAL
ncbi:hypothetical protein FB567DRAFT_619301 [Paraphoma chrysanthemicola]|uniref:Uncharacterized protein n=1 Tax=Paraphoma chrysanthemicola TaxID=798071 RepID=A0A8K0RBZ1_9PLEO|nr:hypothetical protein FB567DRAFT_619301 [Paraphoma chrysanthemicola]